MPGTVTTDLAFFAGATTGSSSCDTITDWSPAPTLDTDITVEGSGALSAKVSGAGGTTYYSYLTLTTPYPNLTNKVVYFWAYTLLQKILHDTQGVGIRLESSTSNWKEWRVAGKSTWSGAWKCFPVHTSQTPTSSLGVLDLAAVNKIGIVFEVTTTAKVYPNCFWDGIRWGTGLSVRGGTSVDPAAFDDFVTAENTSAYGVLARNEGILMTQGNINLGSTISTISTYFKDVNEVLVFTTPALGMPNGWYNLNLQGNSGSITTIYFGETIGISGCRFRASGTAKYRVIMGDTLVNTIGIYSSAFFDANTITLQPYSDSKKISGSAFEAGAVIVAQETELNQCNFINADSVAVTIDDPEFKITNSNFIANSVAVEITSPGTYTFTNLNFVGNSIDVRNTTGGSIQVNNEGSNATKQSNPYGGTVGFVTSYPMNVYVSDSGGSALNSIRVGIFSASTVQLMNELTDIDGLAYEAFTQAVPSSVSIRVRKQGYIPVYQPGVVTADGLTAYITLYNDPTYSPT